MFVALIADGLKLFYEVIYKYVDRQFESNPELVTAVICCYNEEEEIGKTISSLREILPSDRIIVVDDGSSDRTAEIIRQSGGVLLIKLSKNVGKVKAMKEGLKYVKTPLTLIMDADIRFGKQFKLPTSILVSEEKTAVAFNVVPVSVSATGNWFQKIIVGLQEHEYEKSMQIGKRSQDTVESVNCISGAAGLFQTNRLKRLSKHHTEIFTSEDLERTLIELIYEGKVVFVDERVETEVPKSMRELIKQRVISWWPGLYRNFPLFLAILFKKRIARKLRVEMFYQTMSIVLDPLKIASLFFLAIEGRWALLIYIYLVYFLLEIFIRVRLSGIISFKKCFKVILLYPLYNLFQMILRLCALPIFFWKRYIKRSWRPVINPTKIVISLLVFLTLTALPSFVFAEGKKNFIVVKHQYINDSNGRQIRNTNLFLSFNKRIYFGINNALKRLNLGGYFSSLGANFNPDIRIRKYSWMPKITISKTVSKVLVARIMVAYSFNRKRNFPVLSAGTDFYYGDYNWLSFNLVKEFGRKNGATFILKNHLQKDDWFADIGASVTNFGDPGVFGKIGHKNVFVEISQYKNFDFNKYNRTAVAFGVKVRF